MGTVAGMLAQARACIGMGEPNKLQRWYAGRNGVAFNYNFAWCECAVTYWAYRSGNHKIVCPRGDRAYTVWGAGDYRAAGSTWHEGTAANLKRYCKPGAKIYFDWGGSNVMGLVDHVGICERNLGDGRIITIEGNSGNVCARRVRSENVIAGFWNPKYETSAAKPPSKPAKPAGSKVSAPTGSPVLRMGSAGGKVKALQRALIAAGHTLPRFGADGEFGDETRQALRAFQRASKIDVDGLYGPQSSKALKAELRG